MLKPNMKRLVVACVATMGIIGIQSQVEANDEIQVEASIETKNEISKNQNDSDLNKIILEEEILQIPSFPIELITDSLAPVMEIEMESQTKETVTPAPQPAEPQLTVSLTNEEKDLFARLVEAEAKGEPYEGKVAVATVVLNRVDSTEFPNTVEGVITEVVGSSYAFSPVQNGEIYEPASAEAKQAVDEALMAETRVNDAIYFYNPEIATDNWIRSRQVVSQIGQHVFAK